MTYEEASAKGPIYICGSDPGPEHCALVLLYVLAGVPSLVDACYVSNYVLALAREPHPLFENSECDFKAGPLFFAYEGCGSQGKFVGGGTFETAAMGGELRHLFRPHVHGIYNFTPSDWRYLLTGRGNADTQAIYAESCALFGPGAGGGADPYHGVKKRPGQLARLHAAGAGGNMEHMKDALGIALALTRSQFRTGQDPERFRWF